MTRAFFPNCTQVPDVILDFWVSALSGAELKVVLYVARRTYGFGKKSDRISLNQLATGIRRRDGSTLDKGTGLSRSTVKTACSSLVKRGMLLKTANTSEKTGEHEESTFQLNLQWRFPVDDDSGPTSVGRKPAQVEQSGSGEVGQRSAHPGRKPLSAVGRQSAPQETEEIQETAADDLTDAAVAELIKQLIACGLNRGDANRLAHELPMESRRQFEYHQHRIKTGFVFKRGRGAFLRRAIEEGFAEPDGYAAAEKKRKRFDQENQQRKAEFVRTAASQHHLRETLARLEIEQPKVFLEYMAYVEERKAIAVSNPILKGAPQVKSRLLKTLDSEDCRLDYLSDYFRVRQCPFPEFQDSLNGHQLNRKQRN